MYLFLGHVYCVKIVTGTGNSNDGNLHVSVNGVVQIASNYFDLGEVVMDNCFATMPSIQIVNPTANAWTGEITVTDNGGDRILSCDGCTGNEFESVLVVDGNSDGSNQASTHCLDGILCTISVAGIEMGLH